MKVNTSLFISDNRINTVALISEETFSNQSAVSAAGGGARSSASSCGSALFLSAGAVMSSPLRAPCELLCPPQSLSDVTAASRSLGNQERAPGAASQVAAHRRRPIRRGEERRALMGEREDAPSKLRRCDVISRRGRYLGNLTGAQNFPRRLLESQQHHMTARSSRAQLVHRLHQHLPTQAIRAGTSLARCIMGGLLTEAESVLTASTCTSFLPLFCSRA